LRKQAIAMFTPTIAMKKVSFSLKSDAVKTNELAGINWNNFRNHPLYWNNHDK
jgi:hypothetical protein